MLATEPVCDSCGVAKSAWLIHAGETDPPSRCLPRAGKGPEDDAAVASEDHDEAPILGSRRDAFAKRRGVGRPRVRSARDRAGERSRDTQGERRLRAKTGTDLFLESE